MNLYAQAREAAHRELVRRHHEEFVGIFATELAVRQSESDDVLIMEDGLDEVAVYRAMAAGKAFTVVLTN